METPVIRKSDISKQFLGLDNKEKNRGSLCLYFIKSDLLFYFIVDKFINKNIDSYDDNILSFLLERNAFILN